MLNFFKKKETSGTSANVILVPEDALLPDAEDYALMMGVVDYVNAMKSVALFRRDEIPQEAMWLYHADYYLAQVNNGGHSQFIHNSRMSEFIISDIRKGLDLIKADAMASCFADMKSWVSKNATEAAIQNGFGERAEYLDELDSRFYGFAETKDDFNTAANAWLLNSGLLKTFAKGQHDVAFKDQAKANPAYARRRRIQNINQLQHRLTADFLALFQVAAAGRILDDGVFEVRNLTAGFDIGHPTEEGGTIWGVATSFGVLAGYLTQDSVVLAEKGLENGFSVGEVLIEHPRESAQKFVDFSQETIPAGCAVELLAKVNSATSFRYLAPLTADLSIGKKGKEQALYVGVTETGQMYTLVIGRADAIISPYPPSQAMARLNSRDIARLKTEIEAHNSYVPTR